MLSDNFGVGMNANDDARLEFDESSGVSLASDMNRKPPTIHYIWYTLKIHAKAPCTCTFT